MAYQGVNIILPVLCVFAYKYQQMYIIICVMFCDIQNDSPMYVGWTVTSKEGRLVVSKLDVSRTAPELQYSICIFQDMTWKAYIYGMEISSNQVIAGVPLLLSTTAALSNLLTSLDASHICEGNRDGKFEKLLTYRGFTGSGSEYQLYCL